MASASYTLADLPIPEDVSPGPGWTSQMLEMADHIGAYRTLLVVDRFGGQQIYITADPERNVLRPIIGDEAAGTMSHVYRRERLQIPTAKHALDHARRAPIVAMVKRGDMTIAKGAAILRTSRTYMSHLVNHSDEGDGAGNAALPVRRRDARQIEMFDIPPA